MQKIITIVIPTYNMEKYLDKALTSLLISEENLKKVEVLIINDGSKDKSSEIGHRYEEKYPDTFKVIDKENGNYGSCVNRGLLEAKGKYIKILDADDYYDTASFEEFVVFLQDKDVDLVVSNYRIVDAEGNEIKPYAFSLPQDCIFDMSAFNNFDETIAVWHHAIAHRTENLREMGYKQTEGISYTDEQWVFMPIVKVKKVAFFPHFVYMYLRGREGQTYDPKVLSKTFKQLFQVVNTQTDFYKEWISKIDDKGQRDYLWTRLLQKNWKIYRYYTLRIDTEEGNKLLASYDMSLQERCPQLYQYLSDSKYELRFPYIQHWRKNGYKKDTTKLVFFRFLFKSAISARSILIKAGLKKNHDNGE